MSSQIVLMTGCSSGIGLATAKRLALDAEQRYIVIATVIAISEKTDLEAAVGDALNKTIFIQELDVTKDDDITAVVDGTLKTHGQIDILSECIFYLANISLSYCLRKGRIIGFVRENNILEKRGGNSENDEILS